MMDVALLKAASLMVFASYFQTISGFGLGMIVMGFNSLLGLWSIPEAAFMVSASTMASSLPVLRRHAKSVPVRALRLATLGLIPAVLLGIWLLHRMASGSTGLIQGLLGCMIIYGSLNLFFQPRRQEIESSAATFVVAGLTSGVMGGLFAVSGPPLIYQAYRQPWHPTAVRAFLITAFSLLAILRLVHDILFGYVTAAMGMTVAWGVISALIGTWAGARTAHWYAPNVLRWTACVVLLGAGAHLATQGFRLYLP